MRSQSSPQMHVVGIIIAVLLPPLSVVIPSTSTFAADIANYDADAGAPPNAGSIQNPTVQGWTSTGTGVDVTVGGVVDGGVNAWRIDDNSVSLNPRYSQALDTAQLTSMYDNGWNYNLNTRIVSGNQFTGWGWGPGQNPGWEYTDVDRERMSASFSINGATSRAVINVPGGVVNGTTGLLAGPAANFQNIEMRGAAESTRFRIHVNGDFLGTYDWKNGTSNSSNDNAVLFESGSTPGTGRDAYWNHVSLETPATIWHDELYDDFQTYPTNGSGPIDDPGFTANWTQFGATTGNGSLIADLPGNIGSELNTRAWISNADATGIRTSVAATADSLYEFSAIIAAETAIADEVDYRVRVLLGQDFLTAAEIYSLSGSDVGGTIADTDGFGKSIPGNHVLFQFTTGATTLGDLLFLEIERLGTSDPGRFLVVDDVALWSTPVPEPGTVGLLLMGLTGIACTLRNRRNQKSVGQTKVIR